MTDDPHLAALFEARAAFLRDRGAATHAPAASRGLVFECADVRIVLPVHSLQGVISHPRWIPLPGSDPAVIGIVPYRSLHLDVFSGSALLGWSGDGVVNPEHLALCGVDGRFFALHIGNPDGFIDWQSTTSITQDGWPPALRECVDAKTYLLDLSELSRHPAFKLSATPSK